MYESPSADTASMQNAYPLDSRPKRSRKMLFAAAGTAVALAASAGALALAPSGKLEQLLAEAASAIEHAVAPAEEPQRYTRLRGKTAAEEQMPAEMDVAGEATPPADAVAPSVAEATHASEMEAAAEEAPVTLAAAPDVPPSPDAARWGTATDAADAQASRRLAELFASGSAPDSRAATNAFAPFLQDGRAQADASGLTGSIFQQAAVDPAEVPVAETEAEAARLEQRLFGASEPATAGTGRLATANRHVNMRAGAENDATVLAIVPQEGTVELLDNCPNWCFVEYRGQRGYIYGSFLRRDDGERAAVN